MIFDASSIYLLIKRRRLTPLADEITLDLAIYELGNTLWRGVRRGLLEEETALRLMEIIKRILEGMRIMRFDELDVRKVLKLAAKTGLSFYDASYLHLALELGGELATEDGRIREMAEKEGVKVYSAEEL